MRANGIRMGEAARCLVTLLMTSLPLSIAMLVTLRFCCRNGRKFAGSVGLAPIETGFVVVYRRSGFRR
jgi:hypothetical protein